MSLPSTSVTACTSNGAANSRATPTGTNVNEPARVPEWPPNTHGLVLATAHQIGYVR